MSPFNLRRRGERRERLRSVKGVAADGSRSLHQVRRSVKGKGKGVAADGSGSLRRLRRGRGRGKRKCSISLKKRALLSHLRQRSLKKPATAVHESPDTTSEEYPPQDNSTSEDWTPPLTKEKEESFSSRFYSNPSIRWTEEERDLGVLGKQKYKVGSVFDPLSDSWVVEFNVAINPLAPGSKGPVKIICDVCGKPDHLHTTCALTFRYPPHAPDFNREDYQLVCQCGSDEIVPGRWSCSDCQPNSGLRVEAKELPPLLEYDNPNPDPSSLIPWIFIPSKTNDYKFTVARPPVLSSQG